MSDTPISDSTAHNIAELGMLCRMLERQLNAANDSNREIRERNEWLNDKIDAANERIKRLHEAGDVLFENSYPSMWDLPAAADQKLTDQSNWLKAKEAKP